MELGYILKTKQNKTKQTVHVKQWDETRHQSQQSFPVWISSFFPCGMLYSLRASYTKILSSNEDLPQMSAWTPQTKDHDWTQLWSVDHHSNSGARTTITK